eukprot:m.93953 g.93953  ORF g.93953 m.93953 type:complete len:255 (+) comp12400_c0_seq15:954-1718(+)
MCCSECWRVFYVYMCVAIERLCWSNVCRLHPKQHHPCPQQLLSRDIATRGILRMVFVGDEMVFAHKIVPTVEGSTRESSRGVVPFCSHLLPTEFQSFSASILSREEVPMVAIRQARSLMRHTGVTFGTVECCIHELEQQQEQQQSPLLPDISSLPPPSTTSASTSTSTSTTTTSSGSTSMKALRRSTIPRARSNSILLSQTRTEPLYDIVYCDAQAISHLRFPFGVDGEAILRKIAAFIEGELNDDEDEDDGVY